ncbi:hypothetical protein MUN78_02140 [Leucobacter allii]|uniref:Uncharacterized protein n=1 Tax=Leucobacter allii TaxID=2932247 RepID=A0ABY4FN43_9MICO|nr:hypothetical protein [Leucobacter allii]UOQ57666.1 hypothetical protein MUN78_02140 [Leucobacter allii]
MSERPDDGTPGAADADPEATVVVPRRVAAPVGVPDPDPVRDIVPDPGSDPDPDRTAAVRRHESAAHRHSDPDPDPDRTVAVRRDGAAAQPDPDPDRTVSVRRAERVAEPAADADSDPDRTIAVRRTESGEADPDRTVAVRRAGPGADPDSEADADRTVAVHRADPAEADPDRTVAVHRADPADPDRTVAVRRDGAPTPAGSGATVDIPKLRTPLSTRDRRTASSSRNPAPPVADPDLDGLPPELVARMFKSPLDKRRRIPKAPTPAPEHAQPRGGVAQGLPIVSATRFGASRPLPIAEPIGEPPLAREQPETAPRSGLRSTQRANRRFGVAVLGGFAATVLVSLAGLGLIARALLG